MNKIEAQKQIAELKAKLSELEATIYEPEYKPEDLVGKLCYVWDKVKDSNKMVLIDKFDLRIAHPFQNLEGNTWKHAEPVPEEKILKMIYRPKKTTRYDWSKVPEKAKYMYTDFNGTVFWATHRFDIDEGFWASRDAIRWENWDSVSSGGGACADWEESEEVRPE